MKSILRSHIVLRLLGRTMAAYLKMLKKTNRLVLDPPDAYETVYTKMPCIVAMWHGQHYMTPFIRRPQDRAAVVVSRHADGEIIATTAEAFGLETVRGSGAQRQDQIRKRGGIEALRAALAALADGVSLALTADVPKVSRVAGKGIIVMAQYSGKPIIPIAVVASRHFDIKNWDSSSIGLPFGRIALVYGTPIYVDRHASLEALEEARLAVQDALDAIHVRAYALFNQKDPGANLPRVELARREAADEAAVAIALAADKLRSGASDLKNRPSGQG
jgi:lysophospholipid acyltransferase (LPLAT)-like uncharacterized protein